MVYNMIAKDNRKSDVFIYTANNGQVKLQIKIKPVEKFVGNMS